MLGIVRVATTCLVLLSLLSVVGVVLWSDVFTHGMSFATLTGQMSRQRSGQRSGQRSNHGHAVPKFVAPHLYDLQTRKELDIMNMSMLTFNQAFKNPCWWETSLEDNTCVTIRKDPRGMMGRARRHLKKHKRVLRCLPYFQIVGQAKCGTTDLFSKLLKHPHALPTLLKETQWVSRVRTDRFCSRLNTYVDYFQKSANRITREKRHKAIIGEATPSYLSVNRFWNLLPGNEGCSEPCVTNADIIHHLNPKTRIIIILRNPTDRLYSYYFHVKRLRKESAHQREFHQLVIQEVAEYQDCLKTSTPRLCAYNDTFTSFKKTDLRRGIYSIFVKDWMKIYPADQILILRFEDYKNKVEEHLQQIFSFLDLMPLSQKKLKSIATSAVKNRRKTSSRKIGDMWPVTRNVLDRFYKPYNGQLSSLLQNERFHW
ncbi:carbohydrate sulfotransferase 15-like [Haliotis rubra]|uniref:carbohydrate sulfotransferase 15-like n=1 Tax=Haliotis rubra TaxID=36100 RepID=UPI001EE5F2EC|nr:carbohydrate sulfotransferase 15-like [Haliotis rubra]